MDRFDLQPPDREVGEGCIESGLGIALEIAPPGGRIGMRRDRAADGKARPIERIAASARAGEQQRGPGIDREVAGVARQFGHQKQRRAVPVAGDADQRRQRRSRCAVDRRQRTHASEAQQPFGVARGAWRWRGGSLSGRHCRRLLARPRRGASRGRFISSDFARTERPALDPRSKLAKPVKLCL